MLILHEKELLQKKIQINELKTKSYKRSSPVDAEEITPEVPRPRSASFMNEFVTPMQSNVPKTKSYKRSSSSVDAEELIPEVPRPRSASFINEFVTPMQSNVPKKKSYKCSSPVDAEELIPEVPRPRSALFGMRYGSCSTIKIQQENEPKTKRYKGLTPMDAEEAIRKMPFSTGVMKNKPVLVFVKPISSHLQTKPLPEDFIGTTRIKTNILQKSQIYDGFVSSEDEDEEGMSMVSFYKFNRKPIGLGAFGTCVYSGVNTKDGRKVAIKKINCHTKKQTRQYKREVKYLLLLSGCPNIVKYLDVQVGQNVVYIMLELMEGTLETLVNKPNLNIKFTEVCQDIISALHFLHNHTTKTIIHRDIKPRNILFVSSPRLMLKLADFGLSKMLDSDSSSIGYHGGTRCWMAPEVHRSLDQFSTASDVFAAGLVLHYLMTSRNPFAPSDVTCNNKNRLFVEHKIVDNILNQNLNVNSSLSPEAAHFIEQMLKDDKDQRPDADKLLAHPFFWSNQKKLKFLEATANQPEIFHKGANDLKKDLESTQLGAQFQTVPWSKQSPTMAYVYGEMMAAGRRNYDTKSVAELLRFMRNAFQHVSELGRTPLFREYLLKEFIFLKEFKPLFIHVYETVLENEWDKNKEEIMYAMS